MLEDIGKLPLIRKTIQRRVNRVGFIYSYSNTLSLLRQFTDKKELRHVTRFATAYRCSLLMNGARTSYLRQVMGGKLQKLFLCLGSGTMSYLL